MIKLDYMALGAAGAYLAAKLLASHAKSDKVRKLAIRGADAIVAAQIYIVIVKLKDEKRPRRLLCRRRRQGR